MSMLFNDKLPSVLADYLSEQVGNGFEVIITQVDSSYYWIVKLPNDYIRIIEWIGGSTAFSVVNLTGNSYKIIKTLMLNNLQRV